jgi:hypothetical protein
MHACKKTAAALPSLVDEAHGRSRKMKSDYRGRDKRCCFYGKKASNSQIFIVDYLQFVKTKHLHAAQYGASTVARLLHRRLSGSGTAPLLKNSFVKPFGSSQKDGTFVEPSSGTY